jgi:predicted RNase H-like nuclease (RuvC/YqgF family)
VGVFSTRHARCQNWIVGPSWGTVMRDIRGDLQERASLIEQQIAAAGLDFDKAVEQLQGKLKAELAALGVAMLAEHYKSYLMDSLSGDG